MSILALIPKFERGDPIGFHGEQGRLDFSKIREVVVKKDGTIWYKLGTSNYLHPERNLIEYCTALRDYVSRLKLEVHQLNCKVVGTKRDIKSWEKQIEQKRLLIGNLEKKLEQIN